MADDEPSYIDYEAFLDPSFSATAFANQLVLSTNNPTDTPLDLSTPLSRVLFDVQEIDTHIDSLTTKSALSLLEHTKDQADSGAHVLEEVEAQLASVTEAYRTLEKEVIERYEAAEQVRLAADRLCETLRMGRAVGRCLMLGRQLEVQAAEIGAAGAASKREDHRAMVRASSTILSVKQILSASGPGEEGEGLAKVNVVVTLRNEMMIPAERRVLAKSQQIVREFSMSSLLASTTDDGGKPAGATSTYMQGEDTKSRATSAMLSLYLLSPLPSKAGNFDPTTLIDALEDYLQTALKSSLAALARSLATLPTLDRTLLEISARCQNIVALEALLESVKPPQHPLLEKNSKISAPPNFLDPLLQSLDTSSLPSFFWRSLASALGPRVQDILNKGGVSARTLRTNKEQVREAVRKCVNRGSQLPPGPLSRGKKVNVGNWEREAAVMVGSILGYLGR